MESLVDCISPMFLIKMHLDSVKKQIREAGQPFRRKEDDGPCSEELEIEKCRRRCYTEHAMVREDARYVMELNSLMIEITV